MNPGPVVWVQIGLQKPHKRRPSLVVLNRGVGTRMFNLVPKAGLEPARLAPHAPQTCVSAISPLRHSNP